MKTFYIIPKTKTYYTEQAANSREDALIEFAGSMDTDMSAYFDAVPFNEVPKNPNDYPHGYEYPSGKFEEAMAFIMASIRGDTRSEYYDADVSKGLIENHVLDNLAILGNLQKAYEEMKRMKWPKMSKKVGKHYFKILHDLTGFEFGREENSSDEKVRIMIRKSDLKRAGNALSGTGIDYDVI